MNTKNELCSVCQVKFKKKVLASYFNETWFDEKVGFCDDHDPRYVIPIFNKRSHHIAGFGQVDKDELHDQRTLDDCGPEAYLSWLETESMRENCCDEN